MGRAVIEHRDLSQSHVFKAVHSAQKSSFFEKGPVRLAQFLLFASAYVQSDPFRPAFIPGMFSLTHLAHAFSPPQFAATTSF
jgi:hypothetical protein